MDNPANFHDEVGASAGNKSNGYLCRQSSARWIPTVDQIRILRELYYSYGVRSPSAEQIQHISAKLRQYGKIEGKNVFYWFQNHKARERQKKRLTSDNHHLHHHHHHQHLSNTAAQSSLVGEKSFRGCCISGGEGAEAGLGWFGLETALPWTAYHCPAIGEPEMMNPAGPAVRTVETLPLFPVRAQDEDGEEEQEVQNFSTAGFQHCLRGGGGGTSLELSLNSYCYEPRTSM